MNASAAPSVRLGTVVVALTLLTGLWVFPQRLLDRPALHDQLTPHAPARSGTPVTAISGERALAFLAQRSLHFVENHGQAPAGVRFHAEAAGHTVLVRPDALVLRRRTASGDRASQVVLRFVGASTELEVTGLRPQSSRVHVYRGRTAETWHTDLPTFGGVRYRGLYPGIDLVYGGDRSTLKSDFLVAPGADPGQIRLRYEGAEDLTLRRDGAVVLATALGDLVEAAPVVYQEIAGERVPVDGRYVLHHDGTIGFALGPYDPERLLVIDPELVFETTFGGSGQDVPSAIAVAPDGALVVTGYTTSNDFPTVDPYDDTRGETARDIFLTKIDPGTGSIVWSTYLGGETPVAGFSEASNEAKGLAVDDAGNVYLIGETSATDFPTMNPIQETNAGGIDIVITGMEPDGTLTFSSYLGGTGFDQAGGIAQEGTTVCGTGTTDETFPTEKPLQEPGEFNDAFVTCIDIANVAAPTVTFSSLVGGSGNERGEGIDLDGAGRACIAGTTNSDDLPTMNAPQPERAGSTDGFATCIDISSTAPGITFSTYLGGSNFDNPVDIAFDGPNLYVGGSTSSADYPTRNPAQADLQGDQDAFLSVFDLAASDPTTALIFSTFWGGSDFEAGTTVGALEGAAVLGGNTYSSDFASVDPLENAPTPGTDTPQGFLAVFDPTGAVQMSTTVSGLVRGAAPAQEEGMMAYATEKLEDVVLGIILREDVSRTTLEVTKTTDREEPIVIGVGRLFTFTTTVTNTGTVAAVDVQLVDLTAGPQRSGFDNHIYPVSSNGNGKCNVRRVLGRGWVYTCDIGTLDPGASYTLTITFRSSISTPFKIKESSSLAEANGTNTNRATAEVIIAEIRPVSLTEYHWRFITHTFFPSGTSLPKANVVPEAIDIYMDSVQVINDLSRQSSIKAPFELGRLTPRIDVVESTAPDISNPIATFEPLFLTGGGIDDIDAYVPDASILFFVEIEEDSLDLLVKHDVRTEAEDPAQVDFFLVHAALDAGSFDLRLPDGTVLLDDVAPRAVSPYVNLGPGVYDFHLTTAAGALEDIFRLDLSQHMGEALTLALVPVEGGAGMQGTVALLAFDAEGNTLEAAVVTATDAAEAATLRFVLEDNYPNPFSRTTAIRFALPEPADVRIEVFDLLGRSVLTHPAGPLQAGAGRTVLLDAAALPAGVYLYRVVAEGAARTYTRTSHFVRVH